MMAFLVDAYHEEEAPNAKGGTDTRTVLKLDPRLAPVKVAVLPLSRNEKLSPAARASSPTTSARPGNIDFDDAGAIGRRYRRQDEIGTPFCVTVDFDSLDDKAVTVRDRDTMASSASAGERRTSRSTCAAPEPVGCLRDASTRGRPSWRFSAASPAAARSGERMARRDPRLAEIARTAVHPGPSGACAGQRADSAHRTRDSGVTAPAAHSGVSHRKADTMTSSTSASRPPRSAPRASSRSSATTAPSTASTCTVATGTVYGVLGPNGAGKTTTISMLATLLRPDGGRAEIFGHDVVREPQIVRQLIGVTGQYASVDETLSATENLVHLLPAARALPRRRAPQGGRTARGVRPDRGRQAPAQELLRRHAAAPRPRGLPHRAARRCIFLDEPTTGLDPRTRAQMWDTIRRLVATGSTVLLTTQYLDEADQLADRIAVIDRGRVVAEGTADELKASVGTVLAAAASCRPGRPRRGAARSSAVLGVDGRRLPRGDAGSPRRCSDPDRRHRPAHRVARSRHRASPRSACRSRRSTRSSSPSPATARQDDSAAEPDSRQLEGAAHDHPRRPVTPSRPAPHRTASSLAQSVRNSLTMA